MCLKQNFESVDCNYSSCSPTGFNVLTPDALPTFSRNTLFICLPQSPLYDSNFHRKTFHPSRTCILAEGYTSTGTYFPHVLMKPKTVIFQQLVSKVLFETTSIDQQWQLLLYRESGLLPNMSLGSVYWTLYLCLMSEANTV